MLSFPLIDLHQDLLAHINCPDLFPHGIQTNFSMLKRTRTKILIATAFPIPPDENYFDPITNDLIQADFEGYLQQTKLDPDWRIIQSAQDIDTVLSTPQAHGLILHIEGLNVVSDADWERLDAWYALGWRSLGLVWNLTNPLGGGTTDPSTGLTPLGHSLLEWLQARRMIVDLAHMNRQTFWDAMGATRGPVLISHGNTCAHCPSPRNYEDEQLRAIADRGGVIGAFFANTYVVGRGRPGTVSHVADHIDHLVNVMGIEQVALGTDFGGIITGLIAGLESLEKLPNLWMELSRRGYGTEDLERIAWKNAARVLKEIL